MNKLPTTTHLQFLLLDLIGHGTRHGMKIRAGLREFGAGESASSVYQSMRLLETLGFVVGDDVLGDRSYRLADEGKRRHEEALAFYRDRSIQ